MPASPSPAQFDASRLNGAASRGPTGDEGKARSARNADRHGLRGGEFRLMPHEDARAFASLRADLAARHAPVGEAEQECVDELAHAAWRRRRLRALEDVALRAPFEVGGTDEPEAARHLPSLPTLARYGARIERDQKAALKELDRLRSVRPRRPADPRLAQASAAKLRWIADRMDEKAAAAADADAVPAPAPAVTDEPEPAPAPTDPAAAASEPPLNRAQRRRLAALARKRGGAVG